MNESIRACASATDSSARASARCAPLALHLPLAPDLVELQARQPDKLRLAIAVAHHHRVESKRDLGRAGRLLDFTRLEG